MRQIEWAEVLEKVFVDEFIVDGEVVSVGRGFGFDASAEGDEVQPLRDVLRGADQDVLVVLVHHTR